MLKPLLIEVGVEELPAIPFLKELPNIEKKWADILEENSLLCEFSFFYTPRRLVLWHREFPTRQPDSFEEFFGAPVDIAFKDNKPTKAALGFAKKCGVEVKDLQRAKRGDREVLYYKKEVKGKPSKDLIGEMLNKFLHSLNFGKAMRWGELKDSFIRPIRWIGAMLGDEKIVFTLYGVESSNISYPHRSISYDPFSYDFAGDFFCKLDKGGVILYQEEREKKIEKEFKEIEDKEGVSIERDEDLLAEVVAITEYPTALMGKFDEEFLKLPPEVIITSMKEHQRYFPVFKNGELTNAFIVVSNAVTDDFSKIIAGNEKVLRARLSDALFFYENDLKNGLSYEGLKNIVFLQGLGTLYDKELREKDIACYLFSLYKDKLLKERSDKDENELCDLLQKSVMLSKADLLSEMVYEFTELQGIMGYYYAKEAGMDEYLALSLKEQYLPKGEYSALPSTLFSCVVALSNKIDSLMALFSIGKIPSGTKDPFALRRAAIGIIRIVLDKGINFDLNKVFSDLAENYDGLDISKLESFFEERFLQFFDANPSLIKAVLQSGERDILEIDRKIKALKEITDSEDFKDIFTTFKRVANIVKDIDTDKEIKVDESLFESEYEKRLYEEFRKVNEREYESYLERLDALFSLKPFIDLFFDNVMVNVDDEKIRENRKNLIASIYKAFKEIADIKEISV
ncbi:MAG: glycine--tRNA ligase subunit beta [Epsilonproteobacteria bacterium]|nr:glycine--tRNA ligase subunit beta [Campylobacterota bacterium]